MKRTLFSVTLVAFAAAIAGVEEGDGVPQPPPSEWSARNDALTRAQVFRDKTFDAATVDFTVDPNRALVDAALTTCRYEPDEVTGTTPKFDCRLTTGEKLKVKYGWTKEIPSEIAASRLLHALGFGADRVSRVRSVRCYGCPFQPFHTRTLAELIGIDGYLDARIDYSRSRDFQDVSVERNLEGEAIDAGGERGWAFHELKQIDPRRGGATRAEVDALRLVAVFLNHWDNKASNQRLLCEGSEKADCEHPLAMIQDVGSDFGPMKVDLESWRSHRVWSGDISQCVVSMKAMPYGGGTFEDAVISEAGRRLLGERLRQLSREQIEALFDAAAFENGAGWASTFQDKVRQIVERPPCPGLKKVSAS